MNTEINSQNNHGNDDRYSINNLETISNNNNQQIIKNTENYLSNQSIINNNGKYNNKKIITISVIVLAIIIVVLISISLLPKSPNNDSNNNEQQNQINSNKNENIVENEEQLDNNDEVIIENEEQPNNNDSYISNTNIIKRSLGQTSNFDNGISIKITNSIEYANDDDIYHKPMFIKVEISNNSNKNFYQNQMHAMYSTYTENPVEFIRDDFYYTNFEIVPMYLLGDEMKTEKCGCVLRKLASTDLGKSNGQGGFYDINYFVLRPGEQTTAYLMCYFREEIENAKIKTIYLLKNSNEFMYFID